MHQVIVSITLVLTLATFQMKAQTIQYTMPEETATHEGTWLQWPHNHLYGPWYRTDVEPTWVAMTNALQVGEKVHIIAYDSTELTHIINTLNAASVPLTNVDFYIHETDDVWVRDNGPMFVYDNNNNLTILDWGFNGWGNDTPFSKCNDVPQGISNDLSLPIVDLNVMVLEGGAIEHDGHGTMMATRSSITHSSRNPSLTEAQIEDYLTTNMGITKFIWLDGLYGQEITDMHIDGFVKFANSNTIVRLSDADLQYWQVPANDITTLNNATNANGDAYNFVEVPLTQNDVVTTHGTNLGYKGSYVNYYIGNEVVLVPTYGDPNDATALNIIQGVYPNRTVVGIDVRNIYEYGGMIHCLTQQQPVDSPTGLNDNDMDRKRIRISPNPSSTHIRVALQSAVSEPYQLHDSLGKLVMEGTLSPGSNELSLKSLSKGNYMFSIMGETHVITKP